MGRHAYCIMTHADPYCLQTLISLLDDRRNDLYIHADKKSPDSLLSGLKTEQSSLYIVPKEKRIDVRWGGLSQVKAELLLFKEVSLNGNYDFIHLISGADLPLKSQDKIHDFFRKIPVGSNFVTFSHGRHIEENLLFKTNYWHPYIENQRLRKDGNLFHLLFDSYAKVIRKVSVTTQKLLGIKRNWKDQELKKGSQWVSISSDFAKYLVEKEEFILKRFRNVICPDEIFLQTLLYNSGFKDTIRDYEGKSDETIRKIDWLRGTPYTWEEKDFQELIESPSLFARKFSSSTDKAIIDLVKNHVLNQNLQ